MSAKSINGLIKIEKTIVLAGKKLAKVIDQSWKKSELIIILYYCENNKLNAREFSVIYLRFFVYGSSRFSRLSFQITSTSLKTSFIPPS